MKVLQINATYGDGSTGTIVRDIQQCCENNGIECYVAYSISHMPKSQIKNGYKIGSIIDKKIHALLSRIYGMQGCFSFLSTLLFLKYVEILSPDIVQLHNLHSNYINVNMLLKYLAKHDIATVVTLHDCWFFTGGCFHYTNANCYRWQEKCGNCPKRFQDFPAYLGDKSDKILKDRYKYFDAIKNLTIVGVSNWITEECQKSVFKNRNCVTIYNGVDISIFKPTSSDLRKKYRIEDKFVILGPASKWLDPINKEVLFEISKGVDENSVLFLFGCKDRLKDLPSNVITMGFVSSKEQLAQVYSMADVFVNCTREDTLPTINLEAQSCGLPVITFDNTGAKETVDGKCGFTVATGNAEELLDIINLVKDKKIEISKDAVRLRIELIFQKNSNYIKYINLYKKILQ